MRLEFEYTADDYSEAVKARQKALASKSAPMAKQGGLRSLFGWVLFVGLAIMIFMLLQTKKTTSVTRRLPTTRIHHQDSNPRIDALLLSSSVILIAAMVLLTRWNQRKAYRLSWEKHPSLHGRHVLEFSEQGVTRSSAQARYVIRWLDFTRLVESKNLFLLLVESGFWMIPKRALTDTRATDQLRGWLQNEVGRKIDGFPVKPDEIIPLASAVNTPNGDRIVAEFQYTVDDLVEWQKTLQPILRKNLWPRFMKICLFIVAYALALLPLFLFLSGISTPAEESVSLRILRVAGHVLLYVAAFCLLLFILVLRQLPTRKRMTRTLQSLPILQQPHKILADRQGITLFAVATSTWWAWSNFRGIIDSPTQVLLEMQDENLYLILPRRAFQNPEDLKRFSVLSKEKIEAQEKSA